MHSTVVRAQNVFGFFTTVAFAVAAMIAFTDVITPRTPKASVSMSKVEVYVLPSTRFCSVSHQIANIYVSAASEVGQITTRPRKKNMPSSDSI